MSHNGLLVLSLDFEMMWGAICCSSGIYNKMKHSVEHEEEIVDNLLWLFQKYNIHATWATVGAIGIKEIENFKQKFNYEIEYDTLRIDFKYIADLIKENENLYFSPELLNRICSVEGQFIGSHTFTHLYTEKAIVLEDILDKELKATSDILQNFTSDVKSIVFPKNQVPEDMRRVLLKNGISIVRGIPLHWRGSSSLLDRVWRFADSYIPLSSSNDFSRKSCLGDKIFNIRASRFFRPYSAKLFFLEYLKMIKIKTEMTNAAKKGTIYHLWFHPHNVGTGINHNIKELDNIFKHYIKLNKKYGFTSVSMEECILHLSK